MVTLNSNSQRVLRVYIALEVLVTVSVLCRFLARRRNRAPIKWDDAWILIAWANYTAYFGLSFYSSKHLMASCSQSSLMALTRTPQAELGSAQPTLTVIGPEDRITISKVRAQLLFLT